jgi:ribonuclease HII
MDTLAYEKKLWSEGFQRVMGLDEVGRGCLCGPVVAAGVIFEPGTSIPEITDSKALSANQRELLSTRIKEEALFWTIQEASVDEIDRINILHASLLAMERCETHPEAEPDYLLIDGNRYRATLQPHHCIVKGDLHSQSVAAASILAKVHRDQFMIDLHEQHPHYGWDRNKGYPTEDHYAGLHQHGPTPWHRKSFKLTKTRKV